MTKGEKFYRFWTWSGRISFPVLVAMIVLMDFITESTPDWLALSCFFFLCLSLVLVVLEKMRFSPCRAYLRDLLYCSKVHQYVSSNHPAQHTDSYLCELEKRLNDDGFVIQKQEGVSFKLTASKGRYLLYVLLTEAKELSQDSVYSKMNEICKQLPEEIKKPIVTLLYITNGAKESDWLRAHGDLQSGLLQQVTFDIGNGRFYVQDSVQGKAEKKGLAFSAKYILGYPSGKIPSKARSVELSMEAKDAYHQLEKFNRKNFMREGKELYQESVEILGSMPPDSCKICKETGNTGSIYIRVGKMGVVFTFYLPDYDKEAILVSLSEDMMWSYPKRYSGTNINQKKLEKIGELIQTEAERYQLPHVHYE